MRYDRHVRWVVITVCAGYLLYSLMLVISLSPNQPAPTAPVDQLISRSVVLHNIQEIREVSLISSKKSSRKIPHVIHQTWEDKFVPGQVAKWIPSWKKVNPHFVHWLWTERGSKDLIIKDFKPEFLTLYEAYPHKINKADVRRLFILYKYGGIFADLDVECLRPLGEMLSQYTCVLSQEPEEHQSLFYNDEHKNYALTGFMACRPGHPFFRYLIQQLNLYARNARSSDWNMNILNSTGPVFVAEVVDKYVKLYNHTSEGRIHIAPPSWFMPTFDPVHEDQFYMKCTRPDKPLTVKQEAICNRLKRNGFKNVEVKNAFTNHHWIHTWGFMFIPRGSIDVTEIVHDISIRDGHR
ncbi:hypothetical protein CAPTEDRAFT_212814 [Capitella teleta]|uniref:Alpha-1,4-N-acetylglucosaminyltransferase n=1 Tax=Capitella teleta TaxID=283909 RepID=R7T6W8_CAPTE|nr:hypothetical protein CAPTEDRAFT_212814 [Capitella teleta]|eukprot:ELT89270.1 hypothetical protein CAPTEDRAFT_212814 [Capitella teleta]